MPTDTLVETDPDRRPSSSAFAIDDRNEKVIAVYKVRGHGALVLTGTDLEHGVSIFTDEQLLFD